MASCDVVAAAAQEAVLDSGVLTSAISTRNQQLPRVPSRHALGSFAMPGGASNSARTTDWPASARGNFSTFSTSAVSHALLPYSVLLRNIVALKSSDAPGSSAAPGRSSPLRSSPLADGSGHLHPSSRLSILQHNIHSEVFVAAMILAETCSLACAASNSKAQVSCRAVHRHTRSCTARTISFVSRASS